MGSGDGPQAGGRSNSLRQQKQNQDGEEPREPALKSLNPNKKPIEASISQSELGQMDTHTHTHTHTHACRAKTKHCNHFVLASPRSLQSGILQWPKIKILPSKAVKDQ